MMGLIVQRIALAAVALGLTAGVVTIGCKAPVPDLVAAKVPPAATLILILAALVMRSVRASVIEVLGSEFFQMARLKGLPERRILWRHVVPNALVPALSVIGLTLAWLPGGVVIVDPAVNFPGPGQTAVDAAVDQDLPLVQALALLFRMICILKNFASDLLSMALNPRLRTFRA